MERLTAQVDVGGELDSLVLAREVGLLRANTGGLVAEGGVADDGAGDVGVGQVELDVGVGGVEDTLDVGEVPVTPVEVTGLHGSGGSEAEERSSDGEDLGGEHVC